MEYPRLYVSSQTHKRVKSIAKKQGISMKKLSEKVAKAGLVALKEVGEI